jgi:hypothetical protein
VRSLNTTTSRCPKMMLFVLFVSEGVGEEAGGREGGKCTGASGEAREDGNEDGIVRVWEEEESQEGSSDARGLMVPLHFVEWIFVVVVACVHRMVARERIRTTSVCVRVGSGRRDECGRGSRRSDLFVSTNVITFL